VLFVVARKKEPTKSTTGWAGARVKYRYPRVFEDLADKHPRLKSGEAVQITEEQTRRPRY
jgi:hypothetical protein